MHKRVLIFVFSVLILTPSLLGCVYKTVTEEGNRFYKDMENSIEYEYPFEWKRVENEENGRFSILPDIDDAEILCSTYYSFESKENEDTELEMYKKEVYGLYPDSELTIISENSGTNKYGHEFRELCYDVTDKSGKTVRYRDRFTSISKLTVYSSGRCLPEDIEKYNGDFDIFFNSLTNFK